MINLYIYLLLIGCSILVAAFWLLRSYRSQIRHNQHLIQLNERLDYDLPDFLRQCWPILKDSGFVGMEYSLDWFGTRLAGKNGKLEGKLIEKRFDVQEISLFIRLYLHKRNWELQYFNSAFADNFFLLLRMNIWVKLGTVKGTFEQTAKLTVFLQHDVKNMAQLIKLTANQLEQPVHGQEAKLIASLREAIPSVRDRAEHMLNTLTDNKSKSSEEVQQVDALLAQTASIYKLPVTIDGQARVSMQRAQLQSIIDNLLGNFSRQSSKQNRPQPDIEIRIEQEARMISVTISDRNGLPCIWPERLFEPFWSEHGSGRGIGLYQARQQAQAAGGLLTAVAHSDKPLIFILKLPANV